MNTIKYFLCGVLLCGSVLNANANISPETVMAIIDDSDKITVADVVSYAQGVPELAQMGAQLDDPKILSAVRDEIIMQKLIEKQVKHANLDNDEEVAKLATLCLENMKRQVYLKREIQKRINEQEIKDLYKQIEQNFKPEKEAETSHIVVKDDTTAKQVISQLESGKAFEQVASEVSIDPVSKNKGGNLGFMTKEEAAKKWGKEFAELVFMLNPGSFAKHPVRTNMGSHVLKVHQKRDTQKPSYSEAEPQLRSMLAQKAQLEFFDELKKKAEENKKLQIFTSEGKPEKIVYLMDLLKQRQEQMAAAGKS